MSNKSEAWLRLTRMVAAVEADLARTLHTAHGLGLSEYRALEVLARSPDSELRMQDLASYLGLNQSSVSRLVERLERSELTIRDLCPDDKRGVYTVLTDKGRKHLDSARPAYQEALAAALREHGCEDLLAARLMEPA